MSSEEIQSRFNGVYFYLQLCLGVWQFIKLTPVGALIKGGIGCLLRTLRLPSTYSRLQECPGRVFKRANFFILQTDIPAERSGSTPSNEVTGTIDLVFLGSRFVLEKMEVVENMPLVCKLFKKKEGVENMSLVCKLFKKKEEDESGLVATYYITDMIWKELQHLKQVLSYGSDGPPSYRADIARAAANNANAHVTDVEADVKKAEAEVKKAEAIYPISAQSNSAYHNAFAVHAARAAVDPSRAAAESANAVAEYRVAAASANEAREASEAAEAAAQDAAAQAERADSAAASQATLVVKGKKEFWRNMITGGVMTFEEMCDAIILKNQHVSTRLSNDWLLPINLSLSEERLLKILNLFALFLQTKKVVNVHWSIPISLSLISALLEFSTTIRLRLYSMINVLFCYIMHFLCDQLPAKWRRQIYSLGNWVENLKPSNDIRVKVVRGEMRSIISEGAKVEVDKQGANLVLPFDERLTNPDGDVVEKPFLCPALKGVIRCAYLTQRQMCEISAPGFSEFYVKCKDDNEFRRIITLVKCIAENGCGSLISCDRKNRVRVRGFEETVTSYVNIGLPSVYTLELGYVIVI